MHFSWSPHPNPRWRLIKFEKKWCHAPCALWRHEVHWGRLALPFLGVPHTGVQWHQRGVDVSGFISSPSGWADGGIRGGFCWASMDNGAVVSRVRWRVSGVIGVVQGHDWGTRASTLETNKWMPCLFLKHVKEWSSLLSAVPSDRRKSIKEQGCLRCHQFKPDVVQWGRVVPEIAPNF